VKSRSAAGLVLCVTLLSAPGAALAATTGSTSASQPGTVAPGAAHDPQGEPGSITDTRTHTREPDISALFWLPWAYYSIGLGGQVRFEIPILQDGFIPAINDEFTLEPSFGIATGCLGCNLGGGVLELAPALYGNWRFHFTPEFDAYFGLGVGVNIGVYSGAGTATGWNPYIDPCVGVTYRFPSSSFAFRGQIGREGLMAGFSFYL
jgi:hypothetical protein